MMIQLHPPMPLVTPKGPAMAHVLIDPGIEHCLQWVCFIDETRECWTFQDWEVRARVNVTVGRKK